MHFLDCEGVVDSCGDGQYRGGFGLSRSFRAWGDTELVVLGDRERFGPPGLAGGTNGGPNLVVLNPGTAEERNLGMFTTKAKLKAGDHLYFASNGGGGYGLPWERRVEAVREDVIDGLLSIAKARDVYGVAITEIDADALVFEIDDEETARLRAALAGDDHRPRGLGPWQVHALGEKLFAGPADLAADAAAGAGTSGVDQKR
jgi:N-methylhydantoinase B